ILQMTGSKSELQFAALPEDDPKRRRPNIDLARKVLGWEPKASLEVGLERTISYFRSTLCA
ncbi:hypothetical protein ACTGYP_12760, partial [Streptococcus suis]